MSILFEFTDYLLPTGCYSIKEWSVYYLKNNNMNYSETRVIKPPCDWDSLSDKYKSYYRHWYQSFGIPWEAGWISFSKLYSHLRTILNQAEIVYVRNERKKFLINSIFEHSHNVVSLETFGYNRRPEIAIDCIHHDKPRSNYCTTDTVRDMAVWLLTH